MPFLVVHANPQEKIILHVCHSIDRLQETCEIDVDYSDEIFENLTMEEPDFNRELPYMMDCFHSNGKVFFETNNVIFASNIWKFVMEEGQSDEFQPCDFLARGLHDKHVQMFINWNPKLFLPSQFVPDYDLFATFLLKDEIEKFKFFFMGKLQIQPYMPYFLKQVVKCGAIQILEYLWEQPDIKSHDSDNMDSLLLFSTAHNQHLIFNFLLRNANKEKISHAFFGCIVNNRPKYLQLLLPYFDPQFLMQGLNALQMAAFNGNIEISICLMSFMDIFYQDRNGETILDAAIVGHRKEYIKWYLDIIFKMDAKLDIFQFATTHVLREGLLDILEILLTKKFPIHDKFFLLIHNSIVKEYILNCLVVNHYPDWMIDKVMNMYVQSITAEIFFNFFVDDLNKMMTGFLKRYLLQNMLNFLPHSLTNLALDFL